FFDTTLFTPMQDVPLLSNNKRFLDVNIQAGSLNGGEMVTMNPLGTDMTANQRYIFPGGFTVQSGATLTIGAKANVHIKDGQTITVIGTLNVTGAASMVMED